MTKASSKAPTGVNIGPQENLALGPHLIFEEKAHGPSRLSNAIGIEMETLFGSTSV